MARPKLILFKGSSHLFNRLMNLATDRRKTIFSRSAYYFERQTGVRGVPFPAILLVRLYKYCYLITYAVMSWYIIIKYTCGHICILLWINSIYFLAVRICQSIVMMKFFMRHCTCYTDIILLRKTCLKRLFKLKLVSVS